MKIEIVILSQTQIHELKDIAKVTFLETFADLNSPENIEIYSANAFSEEQLIAEFEMDGSCFFFAYVDDTLGGYLKLNTGNAQTESVLESSLEIERIYVLRKFQGKRLGKTLFEFALQFAKSINAHWLWLGVWDKNVKAIEFYEHQGLQPFSEHVFELGNDFQTDILMRLAL